MPAAYTIFIPLGLIVDTQIDRSLAEFVRLFHALKLGIKLDKPFTDGLTDKFLKFNFGGYATCEEFAQDLMGYIEAKIPPDNKEVYPKWKEVFMAEFLENWNKQCLANDESVAVVQFILANPDIEFVIFSETNIANYEDIVKQFTAKGVDITKLNIRLSYVEKKPVEVLMAEFSANNENVLDKKCTRLKGSLDNVPLQFRDNSREKERRIQTALEPYDTTSYIVTEAQLTVARLTAFVAQIRNHLEQAKGFARALTPLTPNPAG